VFGDALDRRNRLAEVASLPSTAHPLVWDHPGTGGRFLLAPEMTTDSIVGLPASDSEALIERLFAALYSPANVLEHRWEPGDTVIWNNVSVTHARGDYSRTEHRVLQRVAIGTKGYFELYPEMADELSRERWGDDSPSAPPG
jgi:alpha-ketoglutarate-dependent taurine dioxygenase